MALEREALTERITSPRQRSNQSESSLLEAVPAFLLRKFLCEVRVWRDKTPYPSSEQSWAIDGPEPAVTRSKGRMPPYYGSIPKTVGRPEVTRS